MTLKNILFSFVFILFFRSKGKRMGDDVESAAYFGNLFILRLLLQSLGTKSYGK